MVNEEAVFSEVRIAGKAHFSDEEKAFFCARWASSGLSKSAFCRQEGLPLGSFYKWFDQCGEGLEGSNLQEVKVVDSGNKRFSSAPVVIELCLPNQIMARINVDEQQVGSLWS